MQQYLLEPSVHDPLLNASGDLHTLLSKVDWRRSALGEPAAWPGPLRTVLELMLNSNAAMFLVWGPQRTFLYNDAYLPVLGAKHPQALARPMEESWGEVWDVVGPLLARTFDGESLHFTRHPFTIVRNGGLEQAWFDFSYTPVYLDKGLVGGALCVLTEVTQQVRAERALRRQADQLKQLFENAPGFMAVLDGPEHRFELANRTYRQLIGGRDPIGKPLRAVLPELENQGFLELLDKVYASAEPYIGRRLPVLLQRVPGAPLEERWVDFVYQPMFDHEGSVRGIFVQGGDVTDHVESEKRCQEAAEMAARQRDRLNTLLDTIPTGILIADAGGKLVGGNPAMDSIWGAGYPMVDRVGDYGIYKGWWADGSERHGQPLAIDEWPMSRALRGEDGIRGVVDIEPFDAPGTRRTVLITAAPIRDAAGRVDGALVAQIDISEQVRAEAALRESEIKFRAIANAIPHLVWSCLPDGTHDFFNDRWYEYTGLPAGPAESERWPEIVHPDDRERAGQLWQRALAGGEPYEIEYRLRYHPKAEYRWCLTRAVPVHGPDGRLIRWLGTVTDVHEQRLTADELRRASAKKDEFLAMLAHELRNPLAPIKSAAHLLKLAGADNPRMGQAANIIERQVRHMTELVDDLLDVSRVTRGLVELDRRPIDMKTVVSSAVEQVKPLVEARAHALHVCVGAAHASVYGDHTRLVQVLVNLLGNAAKYTPQGGRIDVDVQAGQDTVRVAVADNGSGIEASLLPYVFDIFTQGVRTPDRSQGGLGIGLALVKSLVALHGGQVRARSDGPGRGSVFEVMLPLLADARPADDEAAQAQPGIGTAAGQRILLVDDNVDAATTLGELLAALGHEVMVRFDGKSALADGPSFVPEVLVLDIGLPDIDGYELARRLRGEPATAGARYLALTGYGQAHDRTLARAAGFDHHFVKPVDIAALQAVLDTNNEDKGDKQ
jgi:PAS domain S-box-containing protein